MQLGHAAPPGPGGGECSGRGGFFGRIFGTEKMAPIFDPKSSVNSQRVCSDRHRPWDKTTGLHTLPLDNRGRQRGCERTGYKNIGFNMALFSGILERREGETVFR